jgi:hypothetical protein
MVVDGGDMRNGRVNPYGGGGMGQGVMDAYGGDEEMECGDEMW